MPDFSAGTQHLLLAPELTLSVTPRRYCCLSPARSDTNCCLHLEVNDQPEHNNIQVFYFPSFSSVESGLFSQTCQRRIIFLNPRQKKLRFLESLLKLKGLQTSKKPHVLTLFCLPHLSRKQLCDSSCRQHR